MASCSIDNYDAPNGGLFGQIVDQKTGQPVPQPVEGETGLKLRLYEANNAQCRAQDFYALKEGSFKNTQLFNGPFKLALEATNFYPVDTIRVGVDGLTRQDINVTPFCRINVKSVALSGDSVTEDIQDAQGHVNAHRTRQKMEVVVMFTLNRDRDTDCKLTEYALYWNVSPAIDRNSVNFKGSTGTNVLRTTDQSLLATDHVLTKTLDFETGVNATILAGLSHIVKANRNKIYVRVAIRTGYPYVNETNAGVLYTNYSPVYAIELPIE
jgi:hypothetical protein